MNKKIKQRGFALTLTGSLLIAAAEFALFFDERVFTYSPSFESYLVMAIPLLWLVLLLIALVRYRTRGLWLLLGAPLVLFWWVLLMEGPSQ